MTGDVRQLIREAGCETAGRIRAAARLLSLAENEPERIPELFAGMAEWPEPRMVVGLTGQPGSGKSVLTDRLIGGFRTRHPDRRVGVIAVDASSPYTGGALLGDRVRMMRHATDPMVFIRSAASRGHIGGLMLGVRGMVRIMGLAGCDVVLIETVGVGQSEVEVAEVADLVLVILAPGQGDGIQLLKCGLLEAGDIFVVNKADREGADRLASLLLATLHLAGGERRQGHPAEVLTVSALKGGGVAELIDLIEKRYEQEHDRWRERRSLAVEGEVRLAVLEEARRQILHALGNDDAAAEQVRRILRGETTVTGLAGALLDKAAKEHGVRSARS